LSLSRLRDLFEEYKKERITADPDFGLPQSATKEREVITALLKITVDIFIHYTRQIVKVSSIADTAPEPEDVAFTFSQKIKGDKNFYYLLALPEALTRAIASYILQQEVAEIDGIALDAVSEFVNVVVGNGCAQMSAKNDWKVTAEPPQVMPKRMLAKLLTSNTVTVTMKTTKGDFQVIFAFVE
jgi:CheY-specific phosphatase CheX